MPKIFHEPQQKLSPLPPPSYILDVQSLCSLGEKEEFWVEVVPNGKREWLDFKTDSAKDVWVEKLELLESFEDCRKLKELRVVELLEESINQSIKIYSWQKKYIQPNLGIKHK